MDFLNPKTKKQRGIRLAIGYFLMSILVALAVTILVFQAYGFNFDRKTGDVVQNGLVFFNSVPDGADIFLNSKKHEKKTNVRLSLLEGQYFVEIKKDGYREWSRNLIVEGGKVERLVYPLLIPDVLTETEIQTFSNTPGVILQSPDRRWVLASKSGSIDRFIRYDLRSLENGKPKTQSINFPPKLFNSKQGARKLELVEWSTDNKNVLVRHVFRGGHEYIVLNHDRPADSRNLNRQFDRRLQSVKLWDKKPDKFYFYTKKNGVLQTADSDSGEITPLLAGVIAYKPHGDKDLLYVRKKPDNAKIAEAVLKLGDEQYILREFPAKTRILLDVARYNDKWYPVVGVGSEKKAYIYEDPQNGLVPGSPAKPVPIMVLKVGSVPRLLNFSQNSRMIMLAGGQQFAVFDAEYKRLYRYTLKRKLDSSHQPVWMDGHRLLHRLSGHVLMFDFDGNNQQVLSRIDKSSPVMFDRDHERMYLFGESLEQTDKSALLQINLRTKEDL